MSCLMSRFEAVLTSFWGILSFIFSGTLGEQFLGFLVEIFKSGLLILEDYFHSRYKLSKFIFQFLLFSRYCFLGFLLS